MHGSELAALVPSLAQLSTPSPLAIAIIVAIAVVVYEARRLARRLFAARRAERVMAARSGTPMATATSDGLPHAGSPDLRAVAAGESGQLAASAAPHTSPTAAAPAAVLAAVAPLTAPLRRVPRPPAPARRLTDRQIALVCLVLAGLIAGWLLRRQSRQVPKQSE